MEGDEQGGGQLGQAGGGIIEKSPRGESGNLVAAELVPGLEVLEFHGVCSRQYTIDIDGSVPYCVHPCARAVCQIYTWYVKEERCFE